MYTIQYGFLANHSTELAGIEFVDKILLYLDDQQTSISIFFDLSKAFDHDILLFKLKYYGFTGTPCKWVCSYLCNRQQYTQYGTHISENWKLRHGSYKVISLDPCCSSFIWIIFIPHQIHLKQYCMQIAQRLLLLSVQSREWSLAQEIYIPRHLVWVIKYLSVVDSRFFFFNFEKTNYMIFPSSGRKIEEISLNMKIKNNTIERQKWWHGSCKVIGHMFIIYMNDIYTVSDRLSILLVANWGTFYWIWKSKTMLSNELRSSIFLAYWLMSSWHCHPTLEKCIKIWRTIGVLTKLKHFLHMAVLKTLYSLISPNLHFRILSWEFNSPRIQ